MNSAPSERSSISALRRNRCYPHTPQGHPPTADRPANSSERPCWTPTITKPLPTAPARASLPPTNPATSPQLCTACNVISGSATFMPKTISGTPASWWKEKKAAKRNARYSRMNPFRELLTCILISGAALLGFATASPAQTPATASDLLLVNGKIITVDARDSVAQAILIHDGKIVAVGSNQEIRNRAPKTAQVIDLHGRTATPGLIDTHCHFDQTAALYGGLVEVAMSVDQAGSGSAAMQIDDLRGFGSAIADFLVAANRHDLAVMNQDGLGDGVARIHGDDLAVDEEQVRSGGRSLCRAGGGKAKECSTTNKDTGEKFAEGIHP